LYFPYIDVPQSSTLLRVLLYWDSVGTIMPEASGANAWTRSLIDAGLVVPVAPGAYVAAAAPEFVNGFEALIEELIDTSRDHPPVLIHFEKTDREIRKLLIERGLATRDTTRPGRPDDRHRPGWGWLKVDGRIGSLYMAYLALYLARHPDIRREAITDQRQYFEATWPSGSRIGQTQTIDRMRAAVLRGVLPAPAEPVELTELVDFKERYGSQLLALRREVEARVVECAREPDPEFRRRLCESTSDDLRERVTEISQRMAERRWPTAEGAVTSTLLSMSAVAGAIVTGHPALAATGAVPFLNDWVRDRFERRRGETDPVVYAVYAGQTFAAEHP
jgi:Family of unknown function (DUF6236)